MSLPLNFDAALSALYSPKPLPVYDSVGGWVDGAFVESPLLRRARPIQAVCLAMSPAELELYPQGDVGDGGIGLLTKAELYWRDSGLVTVRTGDGTGDGTDDPATRTTNPATRTTAGANASAPALAPDPAAPVPTPTFAPQTTFAPPLTGLELRQSYVDWQGRRYRVVGSGLIQSNANFHIYHCLRCLP